MDKFYVTTPIYYVNDVPHLGHAYTTLAADIFARFHRRCLGFGNVFFLTGTDEHGTHVAQAAQKHGKSPKDYADEVVSHFTEAWKLLNISQDYFIRTTDPRHEREAGKILQKIYDKGYIYEGLYEGWYCIGCERFLNESELLNGKCPFHPNRDPVFQKEKNYFFKLSHFAPVVQIKIENGEYGILPEERKNEIINRLKAGVSDISISRAGVSWGIPIPWDKSQTIYVWVEALFNYYTAAEFLNGKARFWPPDLQLMAKDIAWFHTVIWPSLLLAADLPLPKTVFAHGFFTINGQKMSKSLGNVISPKELVDKFGTDGARYLLMSEYPFGADGDISPERFSQRYNSDLANGLGNLVSRIAKLCESSGFDPNQIQTTRENNLFSDVGNELKSFRVMGALNIIWAAIKGLDGYLNRERPWDSPLSKTSVLDEAVINIREIGECLDPFLPETAKKILGQFQGPNISAVKPLFPRL